MAYTNQNTHEKPGAFRRVGRLLKERVTSLFSRLSEDKKSSTASGHNRNLTPSSYTDPSPWSSDYHKNHWIRWG